MKNKLFGLLVTIILVGVLSSCSPTGPRELTIMTHDSFSISEELIAQFEEKNNITVNILKSGDTGTAVNKAILSKDNPLADIFYGIDNTFLSRAIENDIFIPYQSPLLEKIPPEFVVDPTHNALPVDFGDVCLNYDREYFEEKGLQPPQNLSDLLKPEYSGMVVVQNPATSSPGLAFLLATIGTFGEDGYLDFWKSLMSNGAKVVNDWETTYYTEFSRWGGEYPLVVSYGSSPPFEVIYSEEPMDEPPTGVVTGDGACFRQIEFVGILKGSKNIDSAKLWVDFMLSKEFQEDIPLQMFVFPVNSEAVLDPIFEKFLAVPEKPAQVDPHLIAENREKWINEWTEEILR